MATDTVVAHRLEAAAAAVPPLPRASTSALRRDTQWIITSVVVDAVDRHPPFATYPNCGCLVWENDDNLNRYEPAGRTCLDADMPDHQVVDQWNDASITDAMPVDKRGPHDRSTAQLTSELVTQLRAWAPESGSQERIKYADSARELVTSLLSSPDPDARCLGVRLCTTPDTTAYLLSASLHDEDPTVRRVAATTWADVLAASSQSSDVDR